MCIPDPNFFHPGSQICIKEFKHFNPKKWFLSSQKYDPGCLSRIRILTFYLSRISDLVVKKAPDPGSGSPTLYRDIVLLRAHRNLRVCTYIARPMSQTLVVNIVGTKKYSKRAPSSYHLCWNCLRPPLSRQRYQLTEGRKTKREVREGRM